MGKYTTPRVPQETPMYEVAPDGSQVLSRTWMIFFERLKFADAEVIAAGGKGPWQRTLLLKNTAVGNDIADHTTVYEDGVGVNMTGVLRKVISSALTVRLKKNGTTIITLTIPPTTPIDNVVVGITFTSTPQPFVTGEVLTWDVTASDASVDINGVASFTVEWAPAEAAAAVARMRFRARTR